MPQAKFRTVAASLAILLSGLLLGAVGVADRQAAAQSDEAITGGVVLPFTDPARGRELFVGKGCVVCHAVNGVGGTVAPALDAAPGMTVLDPFGFMARMWRGADAMLLLQGMELGYHIEFSGEELANIAHFLADAAAQAEFTDDDVPDMIRDWMIDDVYERL